MSIARLTLLTLFLFSFAAVYAQKKSAFITGKILDENEKPLEHVSIQVLGKTTGITSNDSGSFRIKVPADKAFEQQYRTLVLRCMFGIINAARNSA